jgi:hypothetical protein
MGEKNLESVARFNKGGSRSKIEKSLDHLPLWWQKLSRSVGCGSQKCHFQAIGTDYLICIEAKRYYSKRLDAWA